MATGELRRLTDFPPCRLSHRHRALMRQFIRQACAVQDLHGPSMENRRLGCGIMNHITLSFIALSFTALHYRTYSNMVSAIRDSSNGGNYFVDVATHQIAMTTVINRCMLYFCNRLDDGNDTC